MPSIKPSNPIINWGNPITKGLVFDVPMFEGVGSTATDLVSRRRGALSTATWRMTQQGKATVYAGANEVINFTDVPSIQKSIPSVSIHALVYPIDAGEAGAGCVIRKSSAAIGFWDLRIEAAKNGWNWNTGWSNNPNWTFAPTNSVNYGAWNDVVVVHKSIGDAASRPIAFLNGVKTTTYVTEVTPTGSQTTDDDLLYVGNIGTVRAWNGYISVVRAWNRGLTDQEARQLYTDPWCIYQKPKFRMGYQTVSTAIKDLISFGMIPFSR